MAHSLIAAPFRDVNLEDNDNHIAVGIRMIIIIISVPGTSWQAASLRSSSSSPVLSLVCLSSRELGGKGGIL